MLFHQLNIFIDSRSSVKVQPYNFCWLSCLKNESLNLHRHSDSNEVCWQWKIRMWQYESEGVLNLSYCFYEMPELLKIFIAYVCTDAAGGYYPSHHMHLINMHCEIVCNLRHLILFCQLSKLKCSDFREIALMDDK